MSQYRASEPRLSGKSLSPQPHHTTGIFQVRRSGSSSEDSFCTAGHDPRSRESRRASQTARAWRRSRAPCIPPTRNPVRRRTRCRSQLDGLTRPEGHQRGMSRDRGLCAPFPPPTVGRAAAPRRTCTRASSTSFSSMRMRCGSGSRLAGARRDSIRKGRSRHVSAAHTCSQKRRGRACCSSRPRCAIEPAAAAPACRARPRRRLSETLKSAHGA